MKVETILVAFGVLLWVSIGLVRLEIRHHEQRHHKPKEEKNEDRA
jgi:hypothetical protein